MAEGETLSVKRILVTGGTGLVGSAIKNIASLEEFREDEEWIFVSTCDADLTYVCYTLYCVHTFSSYLKSSTRVVYAL